MKTLHNIFHKDFFNNYIKLVLASIVSCLLFSYLSNIQDKSGFVNFINTVLLLCICFLPMLSLAMNSSFTKNVKYLINQHFNRVDLIKFFFFSQSMKLILLIFNYIVLALILMMGFEDSKFMSPLLELIDFEGLAYDYFIGYIAFLVIIYIFYSIFLFSNNLEELQRKRATKPGNNKVQYKYLGGIFLLVYLLESYTIPYYFFGYGLCFALSFSTFIVFNRTFKIFNNKKRYSVFGVISFVVCTPLILIFFLMKSEAQNLDLTYKQRINSVLALDWMNDSFEQKDMLGFLQNVSKANYQSTLELFGKKVSFDTSLKLIDEKEKAMDFIDFHSEKKTDAQVRLMINHMANLVLKKDLNIDFVEYSGSFFVKQKVSENYIVDLLTSNSPYAQVAGLYFAYRSLGKVRTKELYEQYEIGFDFDVRNIRLVKKRILN